MRDLLRDGPKNRAELAGNLDSMTWNGVGVFTDLVRVPPSGTWDRRRADLYAAAEHWAGQAARPSSTSRRASSPCFVRRYLGGFGRHPSTSSRTGRACLRSAGDAGPEADKKLRAFLDEPRTARS